ncbi:radical SAM protein [Candidatus Saganbacteria bacterium]|nr:radical SAM protein [Candidatus Saganbacteria bacterium]
MENKPKLIFWETTRSCNLKCLHCRASATSLVSPEELKTAEMKTFVDQVVEFSRPILVLSGGEPLLRPDILEIAQYAAQKGLRVALATNGTLVTPQVAQKIKAAGVQRVSISLDGATVATHDNFRGENGAFEKALAGFDNLQAIGVSLQINTTVTKRNVAELPEILKLVLARRADALHIFMLVPTGCGLEIAETDMLPAEKYEEVLRWLYQKSQGTALDIKATCAPHYFRILAQQGAVIKKGEGMQARSKGCLAGTEVCFVSYKGDVYPCGYLPVSSGNIRKLNFKEIWDSSPIFADLRETANLKGKCGCCEYRNICEGCRARAYAETNDYLAEEPYCIYEPKIEKMEVISHGCER